LRVAEVSHLAIQPEPLLSYRVHKANTITENQAAMIFEICWILSVHLPQNIADQSWFNGDTLEHRSEQLLHSIHTFGCDRILSLLLLLNISENLDLALSLLEPRNIIRRNCIEFISEKLTHQAEVDTIEKETSVLRKLITKLSKIYDWS
jgi:hypothetical protein